jgi:hypothetical protein
VTVASDEDDTPAEMVAAGVVAALAPALMSDVLDVQEAAAATLAKLAFMSEEAAVQCVAAGVLDDIRTLLPAPERFQTPPATPCGLEDDNILADVFGVAEEDDVRDAVVDADDTPAVPTMVGRLRN